MDCNDIAYRSLRKDKNMPPPLPEQIDEYYINRIIETCNHVDDGEESIILAEELK